MIYAGVLHVPYFGGAPDTVDDAAARRVPGITEVVLLPDGVGIVGTSVEATQAAREPRFTVTWSDAPGASYDSERALDAFATIARDKTRVGLPYRPVGDAKLPTHGGRRDLLVTRRVPGLVVGGHAAMEPVERDGRGRARRQVG